jgi:diguanylate cyclase (GGDEF)-like protein
MHTAAIYFIDLNRFKEINDRHGHKAGDQLLQEASRRLKRTLRAYDVLARIGGDEFAAFISDAAGNEDCLRLAQRMQEDFAAPFVLEAASVGVGLSIGIVTAPPTANIDAATLLKHADMAMYHAKGDGGIRFYQPDFPAFPVNQHNPLCN